MTNITSPIKWATFDETTSTTALRQDNFLPLFSAGESKAFEQLNNKPTQDEPKLVSSDASLEEKLAEMQKFYASQTAAQEREIEELKLENSVLIASIEIARKRTFELSTSIIQKILQEIKTLPIHLSSQYWKDSCNALQKYLECSTQIEATCHSLNHEKILTALQTLWADFPESQLKTDDTLEFNQLIFTDASKSLRATTLASDTCQSLLDILSEKTPK